MDEVYHLSENPTKKAIKFKTLLSLDYGNSVELKLIYNFFLFHNEKLKFLQLMFLKILSIFSANQAQ